MQMTVGQFLASADAQLAAIGGYEAEVCLDTHTTTLFHTNPDGSRTIHGQHPYQDDVAPEDSANALLEELAPVLDPAKLLFAEIYFPIGFAQ